jgi:hypothetical protein
MAANDTSHSNGSDMPSPCFHAAYHISAAADEATRMTVS